VDSVRDHTGDKSDPRYVDLLKYHWIEENQHTKTGVLEIAQLARDLSPEEISFLINGYTSGQIPDDQMSAFLMATF
jgi:hypothetical protein